MVDGEFDYDETVDLILHREGEEAPLAESTGCRLRRLCKRLLINGRPRSLAACSSSETAPTSHPSTAS